MIARAIIEAHLAPRELWQFTTIDLAVDPGPLDWRAESIRHWLTAVDNFNAGHFGRDEAGAWSVVFKPWLSSLVGWHGGAGAPNDGSFEALTTYWNESGAGMLE